MNATTKTTVDLVAGDVILYPARDAKGWVLPIDAENPGTPVTVLGVTPWMLTAGKRAGQQARQGRGNTGAPLFNIDVTDEDAARIGGLPAATLDREWTLA